MNITLPQLNKIDKAISEFFEKVDRKGRIARRLHRAMNEGEQYLKPKVRKWLGNMANRINKNLREKFIKMGGPGNYQVMSDNAKREASPPHQFRKDRAMEISAELIDWEWIRNDGEDILKPAMLNVLGRGGDTAYKIAGIEASFDVLNPRSVKWAAEHTAKLVKEVSDETRKGLKQIIRRGIKEGKSMPRIAKEIRPIVGLTERQTMAVANFEERLIIDRPELSQRELDRRVDVYARRTHRRRADTIARTESAFAVDEGTLEGYEEAKIERTEILLGPNPCDICIDLASREYKTRESHGILPAHPRCECCWSPV